MNENELSDQERSPSRGLSGSLIFGLLLIVVGVFFLAAQLLGTFFRINIGSLAWPFFIIIPGVAFFLISFTMEINNGRGTAIFGSILATTGLLLLFQNITDLWATWAYAWALVAPTSIGLADILYGALRGRSDWVRNGFNTAAVGIGIFLVGAFFFEFIIGLSGFPFRLGAAFWPLLLIGLGLFLLVKNLVGSRR